MVKQRLMKKFIYLLVVLSLTSCGASKLYDQGIKKIEKAIAKDPTLSLPKDTVVDTLIQIIPGKDGKDSIRIKTIRIKEPCDFNLDDLKELQSRSRRELRHVRKMASDSIDHIEKMYKLETNRLNDSLDNALKVVKELTKQIEDTNDKEEKVAKEETKQAKGGWFQRLAGRYWWILILIGFIGGLYVRQFIPKIPNPFKRTSS